MGELQNRRKKSPAGGLDAVQQGARGMPVAPTGPAAENAVPGWLRLQSSLPMREFRQMAAPASQTPLLVAYNLKTDLKAIHCSDNTTHGRNRVKIQ